MKKKTVMISVEAGSDARISSKFYRVPIRIYADDKLIFRWSPPKKTKKGQK
jgi:hypothetical protein